MTKSFDLVVIGTGSAGSTAAYKCRAAGWTVAIVDEQPYGGTCALRGCDPKKVLVGAAELIDWNSRLREKGVLSGRATLDWPSLMRFKSTFTDPVPDARQRGFHRKGIETLHGTARFTGPTTIEVGNESLNARKLLIATGAQPAPLNIAGEEFVTYSDQFLNLEDLPKRIIFVGGGYISFEFAHVAARAGAEALILHRSARALRGFDPDLVDQLVTATQEAGIQVHLNAQVASIKQRTDSKLVVNAGAGVSLEADLVVHGAGRVPALDGLRLDLANVQSNDQGVLVNEYLQSVSNEAVYAAGDAAATGAPPLTPVASAESHVVASNLLKGNHRTLELGPVASVVFAIPPLASVGMLEHEAESRGLSFKVRTGDTSGWYSSRRTGERHSAYKVLIEDETERILGAHLLGQESPENINLFALAMHTRLRASEFKRMMWAYPTRTSDVSYMV